MMGVIMGVRMIDIYFGIVGFVEGMWFWVFFLGIRILGYGLWVIYSFSVCYCIGMLIY